MNDKHQPLSPVPNPDGEWEYWPMERPDTLFHPTPDRFPQKKPDCGKRPDCPGCPDQYEDYLS